MTYEFEYSRCHMHTGTYGTAYILGRGETEAAALRDAFERCKIEPYHPASVVHSVTLGNCNWPWIVCADVAGIENVRIVTSRGKPLPDESRASA
jgi:hypothetical protein